MNTTAITFAAATLAATLAAAAGLATPAFAQPGDIARYKHLGAAACATSVCHGKIAPQAGAIVGLNEYRIWSQDDAHSRAYLALEKPQSKRIAAALGLGNPTTEKMCLDCHADNVPKDKRGPKFQIRDGVVCESCHGGSEKWIENHSEAAHKRNLTEGMYPTEQPLARAQLCLSCHLGNKDKFANHLIMAGGHPRLNFELEAYTTNQPAHFVVDQDYERRKGAIPGMAMWLAGQIESARSLLMLQRGDLFRANGIVPEPALYDCYGCHHPIDKKGTSRPSVAGLKVGGLRLQTQNLVVLQAAFETLEPAARDQLATLTTALLKAGQQDTAAVNATAGAVIDWLKGREALARRKFTKAEAQDVRRSLATAGTTTTDYLVAEQIVLGLESLSHTLGDHAAKKSALDKLYAAVKGGTVFSPAQFAAAAKSARTRF